MMVIKTLLDHSQATALYIDTGAAFSALKLKEIYESHPRFQQLSKNSVQKIKPYFFFL